MGEQKSFFHRSTFDFLSPHHVYHAHPWRHSPPLVKGVAIPLPDGVLADSSRTVAGLPAAAKDFLKPAEIGQLTGFVRRVLDITSRDFVEINAELAEHFAHYPDDLRSLDPRKFEELLAYVFKNNGYETHLGPGRGDRGVDLRLLRKDPVGEVLTLVQAKRYTKNPIRLGPVQALLGAVESEDASRGLFVTTTRYLQSASEFANRHPSRLVLATGSDVARWCRGAAKANA